MRLFKRTRHASIQTSAVDHCRRPCLCCCPYALGLCSHIDHWLNRRAGCRSIGKENEGGARQDLHAGSGCFPRQRHLLFDDNVRSRLYISDTIAVNGRLPLKEEAPRGVAKGFTWGAGAATILRNGEPQPLTSPQALSVEKSGNVRLHYPPLKAKNAKPMSLSIKLIAYDLSGLPIGPYLKTRAGKSTPAGWLIANRYVFPEGSVGYRTVASVDETEVLVPTQKPSRAQPKSKTFPSALPKIFPIACASFPTVMPNLWGYGSQRPSSSRRRP